MDTVAKIELKPVCDCGQIIEDFNIEVNTNGLRAERYFFHPSRCPGCDRFITGFSVDGRYLDIIGRR